MGIRCADYVTPLYPQKLALTSPTGGGRSVGIVRSRTKATEFSFSFICCVPNHRFFEIAKRAIWRVFQRRYILPQCVSLRDEYIAIRDVFR